MLVSISIETWNCACGSTPRVPSVSACHQGLSLDKNQWQYMHIQNGHSIKVKNKGLKDGKRKGFKEEMRLIFMSTKG